MIGMFSHRCLKCKRPWSAVEQCAICVYCGADTVLIWEMA